MGQFEKIVVLIAFFLVTVILVVTFNSPEDEALNLSMGAGDEVATTRSDSQSNGSTLIRGEGEIGREPPAPGANPRRGEAGLGADPKAASLGGDQPSNLGGLGLQETTRREQDRGASSDLFLDDSFTTRAPRGNQPPEGAALITMVGLTPTFDSTLMEYTWESGDSWVAVAKKLYGDTAKSALLRQFNEGSGYTAPGERVLVPVFDGREGAVVMDTAEGASARSGEFSEGLGNLYRVVEGDSLWVISKKVYGKGSEWEKIYDVNQDQLSSPDDVKPGMGLKIP